MVMNVTKYRVKEGLSNFKVREIKNQLRIGLLSLTPEYEIGNIFISNHFKVLDCLGDFIFVEF